MKLGKKLGKKIKKLRSEKNMSQGKPSKIIGTDARTISNYENSVNLPSLETIVKLAEALEVSTDYLLLDNSKQRVSSIIKDIELMKLFESVSKLNADDKELVKKFLESFIVKNQLDKMIKK